LRGIGYYDRQGNPLTLEEWDALLGDYEYKRVASTEIGPYWISTVWIGLDMNYTGHGPPIIFETMVFSKSARDADRDDPDRELLLEFDCERYATEEQALRGHENMCTLVRATTQETPDMEPERQKGSQK
jgi:hypothetical protein